MIRTWYISDYQSFQKIHSSVCVCFFFKAIYKRHLSEHRCQGWNRRALLWLGEWNLICVVYLKFTALNSCSRCSHVMPSCDNLTGLLLQVGDEGAGHFVKMVHNGIEYGDMQLICEAYHLMKDVLGMDHDEMAQVSCIMSPLLVFFLCLCTWKNGGKKYIWLHFIIRKLSGFQWLEQDRAGLLPDRDHG